MKIYSFTDNKPTEQALRAHVVYDAVTGKIVHRHWTLASNAPEPDKDRLLGLVRAGLRTPNMEVLTVEGDAIHRDKKYRVDIEKRTLQETE